MAEYDIRDRGTLEEGKAADVLVYDMEELAIDSRNHVR